MSASRADVADVLLLGERPAFRLELEAALSGLDCVLKYVDSEKQRSLILGSCDFAVVVIDGASCSPCGLELVRSVRGHEKSGVTPIILVAGEGPPCFDVVEALRMGAVDWLTRPLEYGWLRAKVEGWLSLARRGGEVPARVAAGNDLLDGLPPASSEGREDLAARLLLQMQRYRAMVEQSPLSTQILAPDGRTLHVNRAWERLWGLTLDQLRDYNVLKDPQLVVKGVMPYLVRGFGGEALEIPAIGYDPDESLPDRTRHQEPCRWVRGFIYPVKDERGQTSEVILVHEDITAQHRVEAALRQSEARLRLAQQSAHAGIWDWDLVTGGLEWSPEYCDLYGIHPDSTEPSYENWLSLILQEDRDRVDSSTRQALQEGQPGLDVVFRIQHPTRGLRWLSAIGQTFFDPEHRPIRMIGIVLDITDRRQAEEASAAREREFRAVFEQSAAGIVGADARTNRFNLTNRRFCEITGYSEAELHETTFVEITHPDDRERDLEVVMPVLRGMADSWEIEKRYLRKDGKVAWVHVNGRLIRDPGGQPLRVVAMVLDITERRRTERMLDRYRLLSQHARDIVLFIRTNGTIVEANDAAVAAYGYSRDELIGMTVFDLRDPETLAETPGQMVVADSRGLAFETYHRRKDGSRFPVEVSSRGAEIAGERLLLSIIRDATERSRLEGELRSRMAELFEADRRKDEFLAMLAHELRNPLAPIRNAVQVIRMIGSTDPHLRLAQEIIERQVAHMARLVDDLLDVSRISRGKILLRRQRLELAQLVRGTAEDHRAMLQASGIKLNLEVVDGPLWLDGDPTRLNQIVGNLLHNAGKFTDPGGTVTLNLAVDTPSGQAHLTVRDTGIGMEPAMLGRLFEPFSQADRSLDRARGGLGLGLALVKGLVELHGGSVTADSPGPGQGSEFVVRLPLDAGPSGSVRRPESAPGVGESLRVLIIEDNRDAAESLRMMLELWGHVTAIAATGPLGLEMAARFRPDLVLCDIGLPGGMDGFTVARALRADRDLGTVTLVALSGYGQDEDLNRSRQAGFDHHLTKPADPTRLEALLRTGRH